MENSNHSEAILNDFDNYLDGHLKEVSFEFSKLKSLGKLC